MKPSFIIAGGVKCGTSSLYRYLNLHPQVLPCKTKEPQYFNIKKKWKRLQKRSWYFSQFPEKDSLEPIKASWLDIGKNGHMEVSHFEKKRDQGISYITGEASASTFANGDPAFLKSVLPDIKVIILLRDPTDRYISHYNMFRRFKEEGRPAYASLEDLLTFVKWEIENHEAGRKTKILQQGLYASLIKKWYSHFSKEQIKIYLSKDLLAEAKRKEILEELSVFLAIDAYDYKMEMPLYNKARSKMEAEEAEAMLKVFYDRYNGVLEKEYGVKF